MWPAALRPGARASSLRAARHMAWRHARPAQAGSRRLRARLRPCHAGGDRRAMVGVESGGLATMSRDTSFYYSFLVLPPAKRRAIIAVWDFCRAVDDAVDEVVPEAEWQGGLTPDARARAASQLAMWRGELAAAYGGEPRTPQGRALTPFIRAFRLPRERFEELIDGVEMDLTHSRYQTFDALVEYCRHVASAVGLICVEIFGYRDPSAREYAGNLGLALQLTNIVRDVAADARRGRIYLPAEDLARFAVTEIGRAHV